jgi:hypothetical protein
MRFFHGRTALGCALLLCGVVSRGEEPGKSLPDLRPFLEDVRQRLRSDELLLSQYTFTERHVERHLDSRGGIKKTTSEIFEVYPSLEPGHTYRKLVIRDGRPLDASEMDKQDRKHEEKLLRQEREGEREKRRAKQLEARRKEAQLVDELFRLYDIRVVGRSPIEGRDAILLTFQPRADAPADTRTARILRKFTGRAWIDEQDRQLVRLETELVDNLSFGFGIIAKLQKGARGYFERRKVNDEIWLPASARFIGRARLLLLKGLRIDALSEYSDYKKFSVGTAEEFTPEKN